MNTPSIYLTPSELVYLNGEKFAATSKLRHKIRLLHIDAQVDVLQLAQMTIAAAFLILEQHGTMRMELRQKKVMLGLGSTQALYADRVGPVAAWPPGTLESQIPQTAERLAQYQGQTEVYGIVYAWLGHDCFAPFDEVFDRVKQGLAMRGLLESRVETKLKIFKNTVYSCPEFTRQLALQQPLQPLQQWMGWYQQNRPEHWRALLEQITKAVAAREEKTDSSTD